MQILRWAINPELERETRNHYRTRFAHELKDKDPLEIIRQITFDGEGEEITLPDIKKVLGYVSKNFLPQLSGVGVELGAGPGTFSAIWASLSDLQKIYAVEVCPPIVELLTPKVSEYILGRDQDKIIGVIGDFDHLNLPDRSVDFIFDFFSLHHSSDINVTLKESARVLKEGGFVLCFDKARPDHYSREDLNVLLDAEYPDYEKNLYGVVKGQKFTRRMNGEKEYRLKDWHSAFLGSGFKRFEHFHLSKTIGGSLISRTLKNIIAIFPGRFQPLLTRFMPKSVRHHAFVLVEENRVFVPAINKFPKESSLLIAYR